MRIDKKLQGKKAYKSGLVAELFSKIYLQFKFYSIIAIRYRNYFGEIDIIATRGNTLVFIEVKARGKEYFELVNKNQQKRIIRAAQAFISNNPKFSDYNCRFDVLVYKNPLNIKHIKQAWFS